jgi:hypothetical protein
MSAISTRAALADLKSTTCACGATKKTRQTFCRRDYFRLPMGMSEALYDSMREGYEEAYSAALERLSLQSPAAELKAKEERTKALLDGGLATEGNAR